MIVLLLSWLLGTSIFPVFVSRLVCLHSILSISSYKSHFLLSIHIFLSPRYSITLSSVLFLVFLCGGSM